MGVQLGSPLHKGFSQVKRLAAAALLLSLMGLLGCESGGQEEIRHDAIDYYEMDFTVPAEGCAVYTENCVPDQETAIALAAVHFNNLPARGDMEHFVVPKKKYGRSCLDPRSL